MFSAERREDEAGAVRMRAFVPVFTSLMRCISVGSSGCQRVTLESAAFAFVQIGGKVNMFTSRKIWVGREQEKKRKFFKQFGGIFLPWRGERDVTHCVEKDDWDWRESRRHHPQDGREPHPDRIVQFPPCFQAGVT